MRLERFKRTDGKCKYRVIRTDTGEEVDLKQKPFFVLMLHDGFAGMALAAYVIAVNDHIADIRAAHGGEGPGWEAAGGPGWVEYAADLKVLFSQARDLYHHNKTKLPD